MRFEALKTEVILRKLELRAFPEPSEFWLEYDISGLINVPGLNQNSYRQSGHITLMVIK